MTTATHRVHAYQAQTSLSFGGKQVKWPESEKEAEMPFS